MRVVIADIKGRGGFVNKDTVVGGYGSRFRGFSWTTQWIERVRRLFQNVPSIHAGYLAAIFEQAGHDVHVTREEFVDGDIALVLSSGGLPPRNRMGSRGKTAIRHAGGFLR